MENKIPAYLLNNLEDFYNPGKIKRVKFSFLDKTILNASRAVKSIYQQSETGAIDRIIQKINPNVKFLSLIYISVVISIVRNPLSQLLASGLIFILYMLAGVKIKEVYRKIFLLAFIFGFLVIIPATLNIVTPGEIILNLITFKRPLHFLIYDIPLNIGITSSGIQVVTLIFLRVLNSVSFALIIVFTTPFPSFIKSFKIVGVPDTFLMILTLAYKYIFILSRTIEETYFALKSRLSGNIKSENIRRLIGGRIYFIFKRSMVIYHDTFNAMISRGYSGKIELHSQNKFKYRDVIALVIVIVTGIVLIIL
jgi:cobalt/nickel transport system permease protein